MAVRSTFRARPAYARPARSPPVSPHRQISALKKWAIFLVLFSMVILAIWGGLSIKEERITEITGFKVSYENGYLKASFHLVDAENRRVAAHGTAQLYFYDRWGNIVYCEEFTFTKEDFRKHSEGWEYSWKILKNEFSWHIPKGEFRTEFVRRGYAFLKVTVNNGKTILIAKDFDMIFYSVEEAERVIKELYRKQVEASLKRWLEEQRYSISEFGSFGYPLDLSIDDIAIVGEHAWAVGYLHGIGGYGHILHSLDGGNTWEIQWRSSTWGPNPFDVEFLGEKEGWVAADDAILHTTDGGKTWNTIWRRSGFGGWLREFQVIDREHLQGCLSNGQVLYTSDGGATW